VLIIVTDDQRGGLRAMPKTERLFATQGVRFPRAYVTDPLCCPSRASIMTGRYPHNTGVRSNVGHPDIGVLNGEALDHSTTIQRYLHDAGYETAIVGKFLNRWNLSQPPPYFDRFALVETHRDYYHNLVSVGTDAGVKRTYETTDTYSASIVRGNAVGFLRSRAGSTRPFFLYVAPNAPHRPFTPQPQYAADTFGSWRGNPAVREEDKSDKPSYVQTASATLADGRRTRTRQYRTLESVDDIVAAIYAELRAQGEGGNTLAFFISDNGFMWGEHGLVAKDVPYLPAVQVPLLMRWPTGPLASGTADTRAAANVDLAPTVLEAAGLSVPAEVDGRSLLEGWERARQHTEHWCNVNECMFWAAERTDGYHYIEYYDGPDFATARVVFREYYDLVHDPWELRNLLHDGDPGNDPDVTTVAAQLHRDSACAGTTGPTACP
jgi:arylsulfatase A-like enzyme